MPSEQIIDGPLIRFEGFAIDVERHGLYRGGERLHLTPIPFKALLFLARQRGIVVSKDQLLDAVWGGKRDENTVEQAIRQIRRALGEEKEQPRFIRTIPGEGYCFIARVEDADQLTVEETSDTQSEIVGQIAGVETKPQLSARTIAFASVLVITGLVVGGYALNREFQTNLTVQNPVRLTRSETHILSPLLSDGAHILYPRYENGRYGVEEVPVGGGASKPVMTGITNPELCDLSRDGQMMLLRDLAHSRDEDEPLYIRRIDGSAARVGQVLAYDAAWFPDGQRILFSSDGVVYATDIKGQVRQRLFSIPGNAFWFRWSADGKRLRFTVIDKKSEETSIWEAAAPGESPHRLFSDLHYHLCCGTWTPDGKYFLFQVRVRNAFEIWTQRDQNSFGFLFQKQPYPVASGAMSYRGPLPSKDGSKLFVRAEAPKGDLVRFDSRIGNFNSVLPSISVRTAAYSKDGTWIAYTSLADNNLWRCRADGTECVQLTRDFKDTVMPRWSPNGEMIAFMGLTFTGRWNTYSIPAKGGEVRTLSRDDQANGYPDWSLDGQQIFFSDVPPVSQPKGIYALDLRTEKLSVIPGSTDFFFPRVSPDGRFLLAQHSGDLSLYMYEFASQKWRSLSKVPAAYPSWSHDGRYVYFRGGSNDSPAIFRAAVPSGIVEKVASLAGVDRGPYFMGDWVGLDPTDAPIVVRNSTIEDIYAWDLVRK
jgi:Tol biopolymer transport system component/DNA-binding winged helix-turn-helix (wHTH) protein